MASHELALHSFAAAPRTIPLDARAAEQPWIAAEGLVTIVAPVWGRVHIDRFLDIVLPSWLAPGNIPALAEGAAGVRLITRREDMRRLERSRPVRRLMEIAHVELTPVDDLLSPDFVPVTLTLALQRGISAGVVPGMPRRFLLLNSDFALADGSLKGALAKWAPGVKLLLAPSLRVTEETIGPKLHDLVDRKGVLALPPRRMAGTAFSHLHHTVLACRMDQSLLSSTNAHQLYWRVDQHTMIARAFCMFALGVEVDAPPAPAAAYCDYGMGALLTGDERPVALGSSDDFLALEIAPGDYESEFVTYGAPDVGRLAQRLQEWTTDFHRRQAREPIVWTSGAPGPGLAAAQAEADRVIDEVLARLEAPQPVKGHPNWVGGVGGWRRRRRDVGVFTDPAELGPLPAEAPREGPSPKIWRRAVRSAIVGPPERRRMWHPFWRLHRALAEIQEGARAQGRTIGAFGASQLMTFDALNGLPKGLGAPWPDVLIVALDASHRATVAAQLAAAKRAAAKAAGVVLFAFRHDGAPLRALDAARLWEAADGWLEVERCEAFPLSLDAAAERAYGGMADHVSWRAPLTSLRRIAAASPFPFAVALANAVHAVAPGLRLGREATALIFQGRPRQLKARAGVS